MTKNLLTGFIFRFVYRPLTYRRGILAAMTLTKHADFCPVCLVGAFNLFRDFFSPFVADFRGFFTRINLLPLQVPFCFYRVTVAR